MAQPNVAREPSMEEILASIRRIIESNEPTAEAPQARSMSVDFDDEVEQEEPSFIPDMPANDRGMPSRQETAEFVPQGGQPSGHAERSLSLADVAARVRAASARQQESGHIRAASMPPMPAASAPAQPEEPATAPRMPEFRPPEPVQLSQPEQVDTRSQNYASHTQSSPALRQMNAEPIQSAPRHDVQAQSEIRAAARPVQDTSSRALPAKIEETANLLSQEAGAHVARSFSELAAVFNGMERRSLEDMAQDMLRPMLQEWLDDNLPTVVERLVREEIERVARGPRR